VSNGARRLALDDVAGSGAATRGAEVVIAVERLAHGFGRIRVLKDRDGDLPVGEALPFVFSKESGFRLQEVEDVEAKARELGADGQWRTAKEWASALRVGERKVKGLLDRLTEAGIAEFEKGPPGRDVKAYCWRIPVGVSDRLPIGAGDPDVHDADEAPRAGLARSASSAPVSYRDTGAAQTTRQPFVDVDAHDADGFDVDVELQRLREKVSEEARP
jgi:hypothetical protein